MNTEFTGINIHFLSKEIKKTHFIFKIDNYYVFRTDIKGKRVPHICVFERKGGVFQEEPVIVRMKSKDCLMGVLRAIKSMLLDSEPKTLYNIKTIEYVLRYYSSDFFLVNAEGIENLTERLFDVFKSLSIDFFLSKNCISKTSFRQFVYDKPIFILLEKFLDLQKCIEAFVQIRKDYFSELEDFKKLEEIDFDISSHFSETEERNRVIDVIDKYFESQKKAERKITTDDISDALNWTIGKQLINKGNQNYLRSVQVEYEEYLKDVKHWRKLGELLRNPIIE